MLNAVIQENSLKFAVDQWYPTPDCPMYSEADEALMERIFANRRRVYLVGNFTTHGLYFVKQDTGERAGWYDTNISRLGPLIELSFPTWFLEDDLRRITNGNLHHPSEYWNSDLTECVKASEAVRAAYTGIKRTLKKWVKRVDFHAPIWVSQPALDLARSCRATVLVNGYWVCGPPGKLSIQRRPQVNDALRA
jgi:hypothetical protein